MLKVGALCSGTITRLGCSELSVGSRSRKIRTWRETSLILELIRGGKKRVRMCWLESGESGDGAREG